MNLIFDSASPLRDYQSRDRWILGFGRVPAHVMISGTLQLEAIPISASLEDLPPRIWVSSLVYRHVIVERSIKNGNV